MKIPSKWEIRARDLIRAKELLKRRERTGRNIFGVWNLLGNNQEELDFLINKHRFNKATLEDYSRGDKWENLPILIKD